MAATSFMTFDAPVVSVPTTDGEERPPGRELAQLLADGLRQAGFAIVVAVNEHDSYGWSFVAEAGSNQRIWCMLQLSDSWLLIAKPEESVMRRLFGKGGDTAGRERLAAELRATAERAPMMSNVRWFSTEEELRRNGLRSAPRARA